MKKLALVVSLILGGAGLLAAADPYPEVLQILPVTARAGQKIPNFKVVGRYFQNFTTMEFRKQSGVDKNITVTKVVKKDPSYVVVEINIPAQVTGKRVVVVKTAVGASSIVFNTENTFEIQAALAKGPDLRIAQITWGTFDGLTRVHVFNSGGTGVKNFKVDLYLDSVKKQTYTFASMLPAGSTMPFEATGLTIPKTKGTYLAKAIADPANKVVEISETNNTREAPFVQAADEFTIPANQFATPTSVKDKTAPNFTLKDYRTKPWSLYDYRGKPILLVLGSMWSRYTQVETAALRDIYKEYQPKGLVVVEVLYDDLDQNTSVDPTSDLLKTWVDGNQLTFTVLGDVVNSDPTHSAYTLYHSFYQPMNYIIKKDGTVYRLIEGFYEGDIRTACAAVTAE